MSHTHQQRDVVIAILGGAGRYWCPVVLKDLALCDRLRGEIRLFDQRDPVENADWGKRLFKHPEAKTSFRVSRTTSLRAALKGADFVVIGISPGPARMFANDLDIPLRYGILQAVGDTTGPGGISRALRTVPIITQFAQGVAEYCPNAWVINYTNPMTLATASLYAAFPGIKAFGCCHEVAAARKYLAGIARESLGDQHVSGEAIHMDIAGVNHFTFATAASVNGTDLFPLVNRYAEAKSRFDDQSAYARDNAARGAFWDHRSLIALDLFRRFGALGAAGDRHLAEFVPWYLAGGEPGLHRWGVVVTPSSVRLGTWKPAPGVVPAPNPLVPLLDIPKRLTPSGEEGVQQMCALAGAGDLVTNVNLPNAGQLPDLPFGAVVETNAVFQANAVRPVTPTPLPAPLHSLVHRMTDVHSLTLQAGRTCDIDVALQALLLDPLCHLATDQAARMLNEMLNANRELLPGWRVGNSRISTRKNYDHPAAIGAQPRRMTGRRQGP